MNVSYCDWCGEQIRGGISFGRVEVEMKFAGSKRYDYHEWNECVCKDCAGELKDWVKNAVEACKDTFKLSARIIPPTTLKPPELEATT